LLLQLRGSWRESEPVDGPRKGSHHDVFANNAYAGNREWRIELAERFWCREGQIPEENITGAVCGDETAVAEEIERSDALAVFEFAGFDEAEVVGAGS
jgi:hypothetical protein